VPLSKLFGEYTATSRLDKSSDSFISSTEPMRYPLGNFSPRPEVKILSPI